MGDPGPTTTRNPGNVGYTRGQDRSHRLAPIPLALRTDRYGATRASPRRLERGQLGADPARQGALLCVAMLPVQPG